MDNLTFAVLIFGILALAFTLAALWAGNEDDQ